MKNEKNINYYAVYLKSTGNILVTGYANECAKNMNISMHSFYSMVSKVKKGVNNKYEIEIIESKNRS